MSNETHLSGYALTVGDYQRDGGPENGGWIEHIDRAVLEEAIAGLKSVPVKIGDQYLGEAHLSVDDIGLRVDTDLCMSVGYRVSDQNWDDGYTHREIRGLVLVLGALEVVVRPGGEGRSEGIQSEESDAAVDAT